MLSYLLQADIVDAVQAAPVQQEMSYSLIDMAVKGGPLMIVLTLSMRHPFLFSQSSVSMR